MVSARRVVLGAVSGVLALGLCGAASSAPAAGQQVPLVFEKSIGDKKTTYNYWLYLPKGYVEKGEKKWPLIIFLHGMGERGNDVNKVKIHGIPKVAEKRDDFPFIAASPQCPGDSFWTKEVAGLNAFLDELIAKHSVDTDRVYLTGLSMGGYGTWTWSCANPERFAALAPICGAGDPSKAAAIKDLGLPRGEGRDRQAGQVRGDGESAQGCRRQAGVHPLPRRRARLVDRDVRQRRTVRVVPQAEPEEGEPVTARRHPADCVQGRPSGRPCCLMPGRSLLDRVPGLLSTGGHPVDSERSRGWIDRIA
jgi:pimeloyl-ACP methyl ester carboxylesterase